MLNTVINKKNGRLTITTDSGAVFRIKEDGDGLSIVTVAQDLIIDNIYDRGITFNSGKNE